MMVMIRRLKIYVFFIILGFRVFGLVLLDCFIVLVCYCLVIECPCWCTIMCLVRPALLYLNVHVLKVFYEQINYYYYYYYLVESSK